jgi:7,8-dihydropterin-6-yl-methyl-4-(beta-D-ribofuranosyl)aminobenzene 5'-phosphate synthase
MTVLVDDRPGPGLSAEHGFSLWVDAGERHVLFDTGQGGVVEKNARITGVDLATADAIVLSHGHYDHTGGLDSTLSLAPGSVVYCHPAVTRKRYSIGSRGGTVVGMPGPCRDTLDALPVERKRWVVKAITVCSGVGLTGPIPRGTAYEDTGGPFFLDPEGTVPDPIEDDMAMWLETGHGLVVLTGCSHAGLINTIENALREAHAEKLHAVIGGFHLGNADHRRLRMTVEALQAFRPSMVVPCHCSGTDAIDALTSAFGDRVRPGTSGDSFHFS